MYKPKYLTREFVVYRDPKLDARSEFSGGGAAVKIIKRILSPDGLRRLAKTEGISEKDVEKFLSGEYATLKRDQARGLVKRDKDGNIVVKDKYSKKYDPYRKMIEEAMIEKLGRKPNSGGGIVQREAFGRGTKPPPEGSEEFLKQYLKKRNKKSWQDLGAKGRSDFTNVFPKYQKQQALIKGKMKESDLAKKLGTTTRALQDFRKRINRKNITEGQKIVGNKIIELLGKPISFDYLVGTPKGQKMESATFYNMPSDEDIEIIKSYLPNAKQTNVIRYDIMERMKKLTSGKKGEKFLKILQTQSLSDPDILKEINKIFPNYTAGEVATAVTRIAQVADGQQFRAVDFLKANPKLAKKLFKEMAEAPFNNPFSVASYKVAMSELDKKLQGDNTLSFKTYRDYINKEMKKIGINPKKFNVDEYFGVSMGGLKEGFAPYSVFSRAMQSDINQKQLAQFQGVFSKYVDMVDNQPTKKARYKEIDRINKIINAREKDLGIELPKFYKGTAEQAFGKKRFKELTEQGLDFTTDRDYAIKIPKGALTQKEFLRGLKNKDTNVLLQATKDASSAKIENLNVKNKIANKLRKDTKLLNAAVKSGFKCRKEEGGPISIECIADDITKTTEDVLKGTTIEKNNANTKLNRLFKRAPSVIKQGGKTVAKGAGATLAAVGGWPALVAEAGLEGLLVAADMAFTGKDFDEAYRDNTLVLGGIFAPGSGEDIAIGKAIQGNNAATRYFEASKKLEKYNNLKSDLSNYEDDQEAIGSGLYDQKLDELSRLENEIAPVKDELKRILTPGSYESNEYERMLTEQASERSKKVYTQADDTAFLEVGPTPDEVEQSRAEDFKETVELISKPTQEEVTDKQREQFREVLTKQIGQKQGGLPDLKPGQSPFYDFIVQAAIESKVEPRLLEEYVRSLDLFTPYDAKFANGGRVRFRGGGMTRRGFLKLAAGIATLVGAVKTGIVKLTTPIAKQVLKDAPQGTPDWFAPLVEKIVKEGVEAGETMKTVTGRETVKKLEVPNPESDGVLTDKYFLYENPDTGEIRIEIDSPGLGANDGEFSLYMRPSRVDGVNDDGTPMIDEGEFFVTEDRVVGRATSPDDYDIDLEPFDTDLEGSASNWHKVEEFATGKTDKKAQAKQLEKKERIEAFPHEDITDRYGDYDPPDPDDY